MDESTQPPPGGEPSPHADASDTQPDLTPALDQQVRGLLASAAAPRMPEDVERRVLHALAEEAAARRPGAPVAPVVPAVRVVPAVPAAPRHPAHADHDVLAPLIRQRQRPRRLFAAAAVAAAAALVAVGGSALHLTKRPTAPAVAVAGSAPTTSTVTSTGGAASPPGPGAQPAVHIQLSRTAYDADNLAATARALLAAPGAPLREGAAEAPSLGPIATEIGLAACLAALEAPAADSVSADLATYAGEPAAVIVVTSGGVSTAYVVRRSCTTGNPQVLQGATPLR